MTTGVSYPLVIATPLPGALRLGIEIKHGAIVSIDFLPGTVATCSANSPIARQIEQLLHDYFAAPTEMPLPALRLKGTPYQQRVWRALQQIPCGSVVSYGALAAELQSSARAVASACRANPIPLLIPCHRVVASNGLGGYMGATEGEALALKTWLLRHEGAL